MFAKHKATESTHKESPMAYQVLCIDDDAELLITLQTCLKKDNQVYTALSLRDALPLIREQLIDLVLLDMNIGEENGLAAIREIKRISPATDVVMLTGERDPRLIVSAIRSGATDYLCKPFDSQELQVIIEKMRSVCAIRDRNSTLMSDMNPPHAHSKFIGTSAIFRELLERASRVTGHSANILVQGESGTGKELMARYLHSLEGKRDRPFIAINCAAIPEGLIEAELFGYEKGAFTGATQRKIGKFELANGGDIFLDEISCLRLDLQSKILRVLQEQEIVRVGGNTPIKVSFRVIAATNDHLEHKVQRNEFRMDLYHRLRVILLQMPPLRERTEDIPLLVNTFLTKFCKSDDPKKLSAEALRQLQMYSWPGNIRELENVIQSLVILTPDPVIDTHHLPHWNLNHTLGNDSDGIRLPQITTQNMISLKEFVRQMERQYIELALKASDFDKTRAATFLNLGRTTLYGKMKELGIDQD